MNKPAAGINTDMSFHAESPFVTLFDLMHLGITCFFFIFGGRRGIANGSIHNCSAAHHISPLFYYIIYGAEQLLSYTALLHHMTKLKERRCVRNLFIHEIDSHKFAESITVVDCVFHALIRQIEPDLQQIHPQHSRNSAGRASAFAVRIMRLYIFRPFLPRYDAVHSIKKFLALCCFLSSAVFYIAECYLTHFSLPPCLLLPLLYHVLGCV